MTSQKINRSTLFYARNILTRFLYSEEGLFSSEVRTPMSHRFLRRDKNDLFTGSMSLTKKEYAFSKTQYTAAIVQNIFNWICCEALNES